MCKSIRKRFQELKTWIFGNLDPDDGDIKQDHKEDITDKLFQSLERNASIALEHLKNLTNWLYALNISSVTALFVIYKHTKATHPPNSIYLFLASIFFCILTSTFSFYMCKENAKIITLMIQKAQSNISLQSTSKYFMRREKGWESLITIAYIIGYLLLLIGWVVILW